MTDYDDALRVVNPSFAANAQPQDIPRGFGWRIHCGVEVTESSTKKQHTLSEALLRVFADWFPAPVLLTKGTAVKYKSKSCTVSEHSSDDPRTVLVNIDQCSQRILCTSLTLSNAEQKSGAEQETQMVGAPEDPSKVKLIG
jgi:hypothetical protein